ncbi:hypothetical protein GDO81_025412 [Engystomops pustulosus]|uniref:Uncharacterized protein n=1 Tax=Engystomops pustulosus TaxID=76066 RepID=A0AAV6YPP8_ENGPU|nr:hypothetical protein GDO81_025412 [Engystomops pustulosus]
MYLPPQRCPSSGTKTSLKVKMDGRGDCIWYSDRDTVVLPLEQPEVSDCTSTESALTMVAMEARRRVSSSVFRACTPSSGMMVTLRQKGHTTKVSSRLWHTSFLRQCRHRLCPHCKVLGALDMGEIL